MNKCYYRIVWENYPSDKSPVNAQNLNRIDVATDEMDNRVIVLDATKFDKSEAQLLIKDMTLDIETGILTKYYYNGSTEEINTGISKLNMNLRFDAEDQILYIVNADETEDPVDLSVFITNYEFEDSDTIAHNVSGGKVKSIVKEGSIQEKHLQPNYLADIKVEVAKAEASQTAAAESETNAKASENAAKASEDAAAESAENSATSATNAANSATVASQKATAAENSATIASNSATVATDKANEASASATSAENSATTATDKANSANASATNAASSAESADTYAKKSQSYAVGTGGEVRENDDSNCAEYYYNQIKNISQTPNGIIPKGTISFEELSDPENQQPGYFFNISDSFVSDERFVDGGGIFYGAGNNVLYTADGMWDVTAASMVSGVKGDAETEYRQGFVNISCEDVGALPVDGNSQNNTVTFESGDVLNPTVPTDVALITSGETHKGLLNKLSTMAKNTRYLLKMLGTADISAISDGTVTGAINALNTGLSEKVLWENPNPTVNFSGQFVTLNDDLSKYKYVEIFFATEPNSQIVLTTGKNDLSQHTTIMMFYAKYINFFRDLTKLDNGGFLFDHCYNSTSSEMDNAHIIPIRIIGYPRINN